MTNDALMRRAHALALENVEVNNRSPFGAVIVRDGEIVAEGCNAVTSTNDPTAHAEIVAIREACRRLGTFRLADCEIVTSCEPCPMCLAAIYWARLRSITYGSTREDAATAGFADDFIYREIALPAEARAIPTSRLESSDSSAPFEAWAQRADKVRY